MSDSTESAYEFCFFWSGVNLMGDEITGDDLLAESDEDAINKLRKSGIYPIMVQKTLESMKVHESHEQKSDKAKAN